MLLNVNDNVNPKHNVNLTTYFSAAAVLTSSWRLLHIMLLEDAFLHKVYYKNDMILDTVFTEIPDLEQKKNQHA